MSVIQTRYRDISFEEASKCASPEFLNGINGPETWEKNRGRAISIETPPTDLVDLRYWSCRGPFYYIAGSNEYAVCPHLAEIGD